MTDSELNAEAVRHVNDPLIQRLRHNLNLTRGPVAYAAATKNYVEELLRRGLVETQPDGRVKATKLGERFIRLSHQYAPTLSSRN